MTRILDCIFLIFFLLGGTAFGQAPQKNHVVEKVVTKDIAFSPKELLKIVGEKAAIHLTGWDKDYIRLRLVLSAKSPDKAAAEREISYMKYALSRDGNALEIRNTFIIPADINRIHSSLEALYELTVPQESKAKVTDKYGTVRLMDLKGELDVIVEFGNVYLQNVDARISIESSYGEIRGRDIGGNFSCRAGKSDVYLEDVKARCTFNSTYGNIHLSLGQRPQGLTIQATRTAVVVNTSDFAAFRYEMRTTHAAIYVPDAYKKHVKQTGGSITSTLDYAGAMNDPLVKVNTTFSSITIRINL